MLTSTSLKVPKCGLLKLCNSFSGETLQPPFPCREATAAVPRIEGRAALLCLSHPSNRLCLHFADNSTLPRFSPFSLAAARRLTPPTGAAAKCQTNQRAGLKLGQRRVPRAPRAAAAPVGIKADGAHRGGGEPLYLAHGNEDAPAWDKGLRFILPGLILPGYKPGITPGHFQGRGRSSRSYRAGGSTTPPLAT